MAPLATPMILLQRLVERDQSSISSPIVYKIKRTLCIVQMVIHMLRGTAIHERGLKLAPEPNKLFTMRLKVRPTSQPLC